MKAMKKGFLASSLVMSLGGGLLASLPGGSLWALSAQQPGPAVPAKASSSLSSGQYVGTR